MGLFGGCDVNGSCVAACTSQMHAQLSRGQNVLKVVHQLKQVLQQLKFNVLLPTTKPCIST